MLFQSPLARAVQTADMVWRGRAGPRVLLPQLREVDLYSFQVGRAVLGGCVRRILGLSKEALHGAAATAINKSLHHPGGFVCVDGLGVRALSA